MKENKKVDPGDVDYHVILIVPTNKSILDGGVINKMKFDVGIVRQVLG